ncbi:MAG: DUF5668 domain-containing protein [Cyclobacteriaceae bacterium]
MAYVNDKRKLFGLLLIIIGAVLVLDNLYILPFFFPYWIFSWPMILLTIGTFILLTNENREGGLILLIIGATFLAPKVLDVSFWTVAQYWPVALIIVGVAILLTKHQGPKRRHERKELLNENRSESFNETFVFSERKMVINSKNFTGGKVTSIFASAEIDLTEADIKEKVVYIDSFSLFGGNNFIVPQDWTLKFELFSLFGGFSDDRKRKSVELDTSTDKILVLKGTAIFGGGAVKSY